MSLKDQIARTSNPSNDGPPSANHQDSDPNTYAGSQKLNAAHERIKELKNAVKELENAQGQVKEIPLDQIYERPDRKRKLSEEEIEGLTTNLRNFPLVHPITVRRNPKGGKEYEVISGHHRVEAFIRLGRKGIPAYVLLCEDQSEAELAALHSNLLSPALPDFEKFLAFRKIQEIQNLSSVKKLVSYLLEQTGLSKSQVYRILAYQKLPQPSIELLMAHRDNWSILGCTAAEKMVTASAGHEDLLEKVIEKLVNTPDFTQKDAYSDLLSQIKERVKGEKATASTEEIIVFGGRRLCSVLLKNKEVKLRFTNSQQAEIWEKKLKQLINTALEEKGITSEESGMT